MLAGRLKRICLLLACKESRQKRGIWLRFAVTTRKARRRAEGEGAPTVGTVDAPVAVGAGKRVEMRRHHRDALK
jgi:hypothetical protein